MIWVWSLQHRKIRVYWQRVFPASASIWEFRNSGFWTIIPLFERYLWEDPRPSLSAQYLAVNVYRGSGRQAISVQDLVFWTVHQVFYWDLTYGEVEQILQHEKKIRNWHIIYSPTTLGSWPPRTIAPIVLLLCCFCFAVRVRVRVSLTIGPGGPLPTVHPAMLVVSSSLENLCFSMSAY